MQPEQSVRLEHILGHISVGIAILDCTNLRLLYANPYLQSLLAEPWRSQEVTGRSLDEVVPDEIFKAIQPILQQVCTTGQGITLSDLPYEGFLEARGRTYWRVSIELAPGSFQAPGSVEFNEQQPNELNTVGKAGNELLITIEDVTNSVRSHLYLEAVHHISSAIAGPFALPLVLDRILQAVQELVGSTRCAVLLIDYSVSDGELPISDTEEESLPEAALLPLNTRNATARTSARGTSARAGGERLSPYTVTVAAQKGLHLSAHDWHPELSEQLLLGQVVRDRHTFIVTDTSTKPDLELPLLNDQGMPRRPGSVLCVPIFEPTPERSVNENATPLDLPDAKRSGDQAALAGRVGATIQERKSGDSNSAAVLGTIEVYHRRTRGFPAEEVELLEQFAQQAGLAIQNARFFLRINRLARDARRSARQQKNVMQAIPDGVIIYDARWRIADANDAIRKLMGWSDDVIGTHVSEVQARSSAFIQGNIEHSSNLNAELERRALERRIDEFKMIGADGRNYSIRRSQAPIHDAFGDIFAFVVIYHDVSEQAAARERIEAEVISRTAELAQRNEALLIAQAAQQLESARLQLLLERLPSGVMLISAVDNRINVINHQAVQLLLRLGWNGNQDHPDFGSLPKSNFPLSYEELDLLAKSAIGMNIEELLRTLPVYGASGAFIPYEDQPLFLALHKGEASEDELHTTQSDGQTLFLLVNAAPLRSKEGNIGNIVLVWHDITRLRALERAREDFFTTMAHELKTPLANIRAHLSALQARDLRWSPEEQQNFLETADEQVERLVGMINHFLDASRVEAGALRLELEPILLPEMFEDLQDRLEALISSSHRRLQINAAPDLPAVQADYELIMSVLINLLSNAFRYAPEGDTVLLEAELIFGIQGTRHANGLDPAKGAQPTGIEIRVIDRGPGISLERQAELFTRFSTFAAQRRPAADRPGQPVTEKPRGSTRWSPATGLGLYISRGIIEAHGSTLRVQSRPGQGATFAFTLAVASGMPRFID